MIKVMDMKVYKDGGFERWFKKLGKKDAVGAAKVMATMKKAKAGHRGALKTLRDGVSEVREHFGPGYRVYYGMDQGAMILLGGSAKKDQSAAIDAAVKSWKDYKEIEPAARPKRTAPFRM